MSFSIPLLLCVLSLNSYAQDERFYRSIFNGGLFDKEEKIFNYKISVESNKYMIDLNRNGKADSFQTVKKDGVDFIRINDEYGVMQFEQRLETKGAKSSIFKASFKKISPKVDVLLLHFYEGENQSANFEGSARLYLLTIVNRDLKKAVLTRGPYFWTEKEKVASKYWARRYQVNTKDYNQDGRREVSVSYNHIQRILFYQRDGVWKEI